VEPLVRELPVGQTRLAYGAMLELHPMVGSESAFVEAIDRLQRPEGYRLLGAFLSGEERAAAAAGFRTGHFIGWGHALYCDDLSTLPDHRGRGLAGRLLDWMLAEAERLGCGRFHLDSGTGPDREAAHRLYFNRRLRISEYHFSRSLG
jgi:GNAT superfamily N-acetyltransferase